MEISKIDKKINKLRINIPKEKNEATKKDLEDTLELFKELKASIKSKDDEIKQNKVQSSDIKIKELITKAVPCIKLGGSNSLSSSNHQECELEEREFKDIDNPY
ncbi:hypothetical protein ACTFIY_010278 [Dictyostelium cf. discoideum]